MLKEEHEVGFQVAAYDASKPLVIDPVLSYSTYLGGSDVDVGFGIAVDASGNAYVAGITYSTDFPTTAGAFQATSGGDSDVFVTKLNPTGSSIVYSTYLGGSGLDDEAVGIAVDTAGNAYVTGLTQSGDFPTTAGAVQPTFGGGFFNTFVAKLNPSGSALVYSTYLGVGTNNANGIAVDPAGNAYVTGSTDSALPTTAGAVQPTFGGGPNDAFVMKLNPSGSALVYSTHLGGSDFEAGFGIAVDAAGNAYVTGQTGSSNFPTTAGAVQPTFAGGFRSVFVTKLTPNGSGFAYSTYLGGSNDDIGFSVAVDTTGNAYVTGNASSADFPTTAGAVQPTFAGFADAFVAKLNRTGSELVYSTYLGGSSQDQGLGIAVDTLGNAHVTGLTLSVDFPTTPGAVQTPTPSGFFPTFVTKLDPTGSALVYSTYLGGSSLSGIALDTLPNPNAYVTGHGISTDFPTTPGAFQTTPGGGSDAVVAKLIPSHIVNELVTFVPIESTFNFSPNIPACPSGFIGEFRFSARLTDKESSPSISNLVANVTTLTNGNLLRNADGGPGGAGNVLTIPRVESFSDGVLSPGEFVDVPFSICLKNQESFNFFVDVHVLE